MKRETCSVSIFLEHMLVKSVMWFITLRQKTKSNKRCLLIFLAWESYYYLSQKFINKSFARICLHGLIFNLLYNERRFVQFSQLCLCVSIVSMVVVVIISGVPRILVRYLFTKWNNISNFSVLLWKLIIYVINRRFLISFKNCQEPGLRILVIWDLIYWTINIYIFSVSKLILNCLAVNWKLK